MSGTYCVVVDAAGRLVSLIVIARNEAIPASTHAAAFALAMTMGLMSASGLQSHPAEPGRVLKCAHQLLAQIKGQQDLDQIHKSILPIIRLPGCEESYSQDPGQTLR